MAGLQKYQRHVIFNGPQQHGGPGTRYFSYVGISTEYRIQADRFFTATDAMHFAQRTNIPLEALHYIGIEDFTDFELR